MKARILESIITWSTLGKQTAQAKEVYCDVIDIEKKVFKELDIELYICNYNLSAKCLTLEYKRNLLLTFLYKAVVNRAICVRVLILCYFVWLVECCHQNDPQTEL